VRTEQQMKKEAELAAPIIRELCSLVIDFGKEYAIQKRKANIVDFDDLEHMALGLLINEDGTKTQLCSEISADISEVLVDEYQDTNEVQDIILQHHGVTPVMFFYHKALQMADGKHVDINDFRYAGPKPQTKEASIVMLADTIEAAVRSMKEPTPKGIDQFIERLIRGKLEDGQLSDCQLSFRDVDQICSAFSDILKGVYHERIEYPKVQQFAVRNEVKPAVPSDQSPSDKNEQPDEPSGQEPDPRPAEPQTPSEQEQMPPNAADPNMKGETVSAD